MSRKVSDWPAVSISKFLESDFTAPIAAMVSYVQKKRELKNAILQIKNRLTKNQVPLVGIFYLWKIVPSSRYSSQKSKIYFHYSFFYFRDKKEKSPYLKRYQVRNWVLQTSWRNFWTDRNTILCAGHKRESIHMVLWS